jgi:uncharacterized protein (UPF0333 family)
MKLKFTFTSLEYLILLSVVVLFVLYFRMGSGSDSDPVGLFLQQRKGGRRKYIIAQYSSSASITKLYDSMYYDVENRNMSSCSGLNILGRPT